MNVELLCIEGCPSAAAAATRTREALDRLGLRDVPVRSRALRTPEEAAETAFAGSPTITVNEVDLFPSNGRTANLACRVYPSEAGLAGSPSTDQITEALRALL